MLVEGAGHHHVWVRPIPVVGRRGPCELEAAAALKSLDGIPHADEEARDLGQERPSVAPGHVVRANLSQRRGTRARLVRTPRVYASHGANVNERTRPGFERRRPHALTRTLSTCAYGVGPTASLSHWPSVPLPVAAGCKVAQWLREATFRKFDVHALRERGDIHHRGGSRPRLSCGLEPSVHGVLWILLSPLHR